MKNNPNQPNLIFTEQAPIPGTQLYRRYQDGRELAPVYLAEAWNELPAQEQALSIGLGSVQFGDHLYYHNAGTWYSWSL